MSIDKSLIIDNLKTLIITILTFIALAIIIFIFNKLLFKEYIYYSKLLYITSDPENKFTTEDFINFKEELDNQTLINNIVSDIKNDFDINFDENDYKNSLKISKKDQYILLKSKANNPKLAEQIGYKTIVYITATSSTNSFYPIEYKVKETISLKDAVIVGSFIGSIAGIFIILSKNKNKEGYNNE